MSRERSSAVMDDGHEARGGDADTQQARVAYLALLKEEFRRSWPHGTVRSSEWGEREAFDKAKKKIADVTALIEKELGL